MIFVPLPLFACFLLCLACLWFVRTQDLHQRPHQLFLGVIILLALQSLLVTLRWGYGLDWARWPSAFLAPLPPVVVFLAYRSLSRQLRGRDIWPLAVVCAVWCVTAIAPDLADGLIMLTYLAFGFALLRYGARGQDRLVLSPLGDASRITRAMMLTAAALIASGMIDAAIVADFIWQGGRHVPLLVGVAQSLSVLVIGLCATTGRATETDSAISEPVQVETSTDEDAQIIARIEGLFTTEALHRDEELTLRRLARRLALPDRRVSNAINRHRGQSVSQFVNEFRIKDACHLLETTGDTVLAISMLSGFASKSNFNREFSRVTGRSPSKWREGRRKGAEA
ncbi:helix-turn-helix domain-containing protein [Donghicola sp. XS_ASV15]|uniref:helix-turn-helix domain-containing protein n=1 Tax=Donghicola sp. XS_ASV15 TaxID=3241295 RepID=UPI003513B6EC